MLSQRTPNNLLNHTNVTIPIKIWFLSVSFLCLFGPVALSAPVSVEYVGIAGKVFGFPMFSSVSEGEAYTLSFKLDNGASSIIGQTWTSDDIKSIRIEFNDARDVIVELFNLHEGTVNIEGEVVTDSSGNLINFFSRVEIEGDKYRQIGLSGSGSFSRINGGRFTFRLDDSVDTVNYLIHVSETNVRYAVDLADTGVSMSVGDWSLNVWRDIFVTREQLNYWLVSPTTASLLGKTPDNDSLELTIPESFDYQGSTYTVDSVAPFAFSDGALTMLHIPTNITKIGMYAFKNNNLEKLSLGQGLREIGYQAFYSNNLVDLQLPSQIQQIDNLAFANNSLTEIVIPASLVTLHEAAFSDNLLSAIYFAGDYRPYVYPQGFDLGAFLRNPESAVIYACNEAVGWNNKAFFGFDGGSSITVRVGEEACDNDQDGLITAFDAFPEDASETSDSDGDGVGDNSDAFPSLVNHGVSGTTAIRVRPTQVQSTCELSAFSTPSVPSEKTGMAHSGLGFAIDFSLTGCSQATPESLQVQISLRDIPASGSKVYKIDYDGDWREVVDATISGEILTYTLTDNGAYDLDMMQGSIRDPITVAMPDLGASAERVPSQQQQPVPALPLFGLLTLGGLLGLFGVRKLRK